jgi:hypothetical protein
MLVTVSIVGQSCFKKKLRNNDTTLATCLLLNFATREKTLKSPACFALSHTSAAMKKIDDDDVFVKYATNSVIYFTSSFLSGLHNTTSLLLCTRQCTMHITICLASFLDRGTNSNIMPNAGGQKCRVTRAHRGAERGNCTVLKRVCTAPPLFEQNIEKQQPGSNIEFELRC